MPTPSRPGALRPARQTLYWAVAAFLLFLLAAQLHHVAVVDSPNWDEAHHLYDGYLILTEHDYRANAEVPPLVKITAALPLLRLHPSLTPDTGTGQLENAFLNGRLFVFGNGGDRLLVPARGMCILFSLLTAALVFVAARHIFGSAAALCALLLFTFDPLVLAHGSLISTDMGSACFLLAATYAFFRYAQSQAEAQTRTRTILWLLATGVLAGLALAAKFTGILVAPMLLGMAILQGLFTKDRDIKSRLLTAAQLVAAALAALTLAWIVLWSFYGFRYAPAPAGLALSPALPEYLATLPVPRQGVLLAQVARFHFLPQAYIWGLANTKHTEWQYTSYFFGRIYRHGPWQYFPTAFLIKSTLPLLLLLVLLLPAVRRGTRLNLATNGQTRRENTQRAAIFLLVPVLLYFAVVTTSHFDIGARHLLPIYPFLYIATGAVAATLLRSARPWAVLAVALLGWQVVITVRVAPYYMSYGNEAWGGPLHVRRYLSDANVDWGEQLKTVKQYLTANNITDCWFGYFPDGAVQPSDYGIPCRRLPTPSSLGWFRLPTDVPPEISGTVLLSESVLDGVESGDGPLNPYADFQHRTPAAILHGGGVYVYRGTFPVPLAAAWVAVRNSGDAGSANHPAQALAFAQQAVTLAPLAVSTQVRLADVLAAQQQWRPALDHYLLAQTALQQRPDLLDDEFEATVRNGIAVAQQHLNAAAPATPTALSAP